MRSFEELRLDAPSNLELVSLDDLSRFRKSEVTESDQQSDRRELSALGGVGAAYGFGVGGLSNIVMMVTLMTLRGVVVIVAEPGVQ